MKKTRGWKSNATVPLNGPKPQIGLNLKRARKWDCTSETLPWMGLNLKWARTTHRTEPQIGQDLTEARNKNPTEPGRIMDGIPYLSPRSNLSTFLAVRRTNKAEPWMEPTPQMGRIHNWHWNWKGTETPIGKEPYWILTWNGINPWMGLKIQRDRGQTGTKPGVDWTLNGTETPTGQGSDWD